MYRQHQTPSPTTTATTHNDVPQSPLVPDSKDILPAVEPHSSNLPEKDCQLAGQLILQGTVLRTLRTMLHVYVCRGALQGPTPVDEYDWGKLELPALIIATDQHALVQLDKNTLRYRKACLAPFSSKAWGSLEASHLYASLDYAILRIGGRVLVDLEKLRTQILAIIIYRITGLSRNPVVLDGCRSSFEIFEEADEGETADKENQSHDSSKRQRSGGPDANEGDESADVDDAAGEKIKWRKLNDGEG